MAIFSKCVRTKGGHSLQRSILSWSLCAFHPSSPSINHQHALPIPLHLALLLRSPHRLDPPSTFCLVSPHHISQSISIFLAAVVLPHSHTGSLQLHTLSIEPSHFYFPSPSSSLYSIFHFFTHLDTHGTQRMGCEYFI